MLLAAAGAAHAEVLVDNLGQTEGATRLSPEVDNAQAFTTGGNSTGYTLTDVEIHIGRSGVNTNASFTVKIAADSSNQPGSELATLTPPTPLARGVMKFTHSGLELTANTTYFVFLDSQTDGAGNFRTNSSGGETGRPGWSIADNSRRISTGGAWESVSAPLRMRINGSAKAVPAVANLEVSQVTAQPTQLKVSWDTYTGAEKYLVAWKTGSGALDSHETTGTEYTISGLTPAATYTVEVFAVDTDTDPETYIARSQDTGTPVVPVLTISGGDAVTEGTSATFTVTASFVPASDLEVSLFVWDASDPSDFLATADQGLKKVTITGGDAGSTTATYTVPTEDDDEGEPDGDIEVRIVSNSAYSVGNPYSATVKVNDDDGPQVPTVTISGGDAVTEGTAATFTVSASPAPASDLEVTLWVWDEDGLGDFLAADDEGLRRITIDASETSLTFSIPTVADTDDEPDGDITISLVDDPDYVIGGSRFAHVVVNDDDATTATLALSPASIGENGGVSTVTATLSLASSEETTLAVSAAPVPPAVADDFTLSPNRTLTIAAGETASTGAVTVTAVNNDAGAPNKAVTVSATVSNAEGIAAPASRTLTIRDDDASPATPAATLALSPARIGENGGVSTVTATLDRPSSAATTLAVSAAPVSPAVAGDFILSPNRTLTIAANATASTGTVTITAVDNTDVAEDKLVTVSATASNTRGVTAPASRTLTITDDDGDASPAVVGLRVTSDPGEDGRYTAGEVIEVEVVFNTAVRADRSAKLALDLNGAVRDAVPGADQEAGETVSFRYVVGEDDRDPDGFAVPPDSLAGNRDPIRGLVDDTPADLDIGMHAIRAAGGHPVGPAAVPLMPPASATGRQGFVRVVNHSDRAGEVEVRARDDAGLDYGPVTFAMAPESAFHFNSADLEQGNARKGLQGATGDGTGDWRLELRSDLDIEVLGYVRHADGFLTAMHDMAPREDGRVRLATVNPGRNESQVSRVRLAHRGAGALAVRLTALDDAGRPSDGAATADLAAGGGAAWASAELETGSDPDVAGGLGTGTGKWRLRAEAEGPFTLMGLMESPSGHLANLSSAPLEPVDGTLVIPLFLSAADDRGRQGFVRVINRSDEAGTVVIRAHDDSDLSYERLTLSVGAGEAVHFNSGDLESGNAGKGLTGSTGPAHAGHWWLELSSDLDYEALAYVRHADGFLTSMHDSVPVWAGVHRVATFNPGSNMGQVSHLRLLNTGSAGIEVRIRGIDSAGASPGEAVVVSVPAGRSRTLSAQELEAGGDGLEGALGDGAGKWRLLVESGGDASMRVMSLMRSPSGQLANLSTRTATRAE